MCTAISFTTKKHYFGRNLDLHHRYDESVVITPRRYPFLFSATDRLVRHHSMIGIASVVDGYPLYYDAVNEFGLGVAGLNFPGNAIYSAPHPRKLNIASFELIPFILSQCRTVTEVRVLLENANITDAAFRGDLPVTPLHWMICDKTESVVLESVTDGLHLLNNPVGVLTNNPPFPYHLQNLTNYLNITSSEPMNRFCPSLTLEPYSFGMGGIGLPGDLSSVSRFVRAAFTKLNSCCGEDEADSVAQFFHIMDSVAQVQGCVRLKDGMEKTVYSSCCNTDEGIYYYKSYSNNQITAVRLDRLGQEEKALSIYPLRWKQNIYYE